MLIDLKNSTSIIEKMEEAYYFLFIREFITTFQQHGLNTEAVSINILEMRLSFMAGKTVKL
jgi:hypothetical protein